MTIDRLGGIDPLRNVQNLYKTEKSSAKTPTDSVSVSDEARALAEAYKVKEIVAAADDVRADRVAEVQAKLQNPDYINDSVIDMVADRIMGVFGL